MKKSMFFLFGLLFLATAASAQRQETLFGDRGLHFSGIWGSFTSNYTFYEDDSGYQPGGNIGLEFGRSVFLGYAWSKLSDEIRLPQGGGAYRLRQNNFLISLMPAPYKVLHPVISFQTGGGRLTFADGRSERVFILQPSAGIELNVFKWFHISGEGGYRFISDVDLPGVAREDVSEFFAQLNLRFGISWGRY